MRDVFSMAETDTRLKRVARGEYAGACPGCGGNDRFHIKQKERNGELVWVWMCRGCWEPSAKGWGDAIEYCRQFRSMSFTEARDYVNEIDEAREQVSTTLARLDKAKREGATASEQWQERARTFINAASERLFTKDGAACLAFSRERGLTDDTIRKARLGYAKRTHPETHKSVPCLVIPWYEGEKIIRVQFRDITPGVPHGERYFLLTGSGNEGLYLGDSLALKRPVTVLVEGELDALIAAQTCGDIASVVATGSTAHNRNFKTLARLARQETILVAFDNDQAGEDDAVYWLERLENAIRYRPLEKDINAMLLAGYDVRAWIATAIEMLTQSDQAGEQLQESEPGGLCATCLDAGIETITTYEHEDGFMYCEQHRPGAPEETAPGAVLNRDETLARLADKLPGWKIEILAPGADPRKSAPDEPAQKEKADYRARRATRQEPATWRPDEKLFSHYEGGYAGYVQQQTARPHGPATNLWLEANPAYKLVAQARVILQARGYDLRLRFNRESVFCLYAKPVGSLSTDIKRMDMVCPLSDIEAWLAAQN